jgi:outer membrane lipoprotein SlyB
MKIFVLALALSLTLSSCARDLNNNVYTEGATTGIVYEGTVISARQVTIKGSDKLGEKPGVGTLAGGIGGGIAGSEIGKGKGSSAGAVGGAVAGAVLGAIIESQLNTQQGMEYIVKLSDDNVDSKSKTKNSNQTKNGSVAQQIRGSTSLGLKSNVISIVQGMDHIFQAGHKVYVIYNDDRPRVVPRF